MNYKAPMRVRTTAATTATISAATLTPAVTAANKTYDQTVAATLTGCSLAGVIAYGQPDSGMPPFGKSACRKRPGLTWRLSAWGQTLK